MNAADRKGGAKPQAAMETPPVETLPAEVV